MFVETPACDICGNLASLLVRPETVKSDATGVQSGAALGRRQSRNGPDEAENGYDSVKRYGTGAVIIQ
jgi:hypothetical protein